MLWGVLLGAPAGAASASSLQFNRDIRPLLSDRCYACHGPDAGNRQAGLRLDMEASAKAALKNGHLPIAPGDPANSEIYKRIVSDSPTRRMPPAYKGHDKLTALEIGRIEQWIKEGAPWQSHWSYSPPVRPVPPSAGHPIDAFVRARLTQEGLSPAPRADRATLLRRVSLDLTGLPPTPAETQAFLQDASPHAYERVVDRLLASPRSAERLAYRWMEAARYADTNGYQMDGQREMWRWRDWVIDAFRRNMPFDQFTIEQIAGDLLPHATREQRLATGFHRNHRTNAEGGIVPEEFRVEYVADRVETTSAVWLGMTLGCARCHDHKYDPLRQKDFYRMFAFFNNVPEKGLVYHWGNEEPLMEAPTPAQQITLDALEARVRQTQAEYARLRPQLAPAQRRWERTAALQTPSDWSVTAGLRFRQKQPAHFDGQLSFTPQPEQIKLDYLSPFTFSARIRPEAATGAILSKTEEYAEGQGHALYLMDGRLRLHIIFRWTDIGMRVESEEKMTLNEWQHVAVTYDGSRYARGVRMYRNGQPLKIRVLFDELNWPMNVKEPIRLGSGGGLQFQGSIEDARIYDRAVAPEEAASLAAIAPVRELAAKDPRQRSAAEEAKLRLCFWETGAPRPLRAAQQAARHAEQERQAFHKKLPTVMVMSELPQPRPTYVLKRGAYDAPGEQVAPGVPAVLPQLPESWPQNRLGLARWLIDRRNPLTARVVVNRYWAMLFGTGLVKTGEDFGSQGEWPLYPELLDWLAVEWMDAGWDVRHLLKTIVLSETYQQSSQLTPVLRQRDPENRLLARGARFRLAPEMVRDQALFVSGLLVEKQGGPSVKPYQPEGLWQELAGGQGYVPDRGEGLYRRSLYTYWKRTAAPPSMVNFDSPTRETCTARETRTNTPLQALTLMNDVAYVEAARKFAERMLQAEATPEARLRWAYEQALTRPPRPRETKAVLALLHQFQQRYAADPAAAQALLQQGESRAAATLPSAELAAYTMAASLIFNLDEMVTKE